MAAMIKQFQQYWSVTAQALGLSSTHAERVLLALLKAYQESQRHYHTGQHIVECLQFYQQVRDQLAEPVVVELALWFHDFIYDPQASDNELQSAQFMQQLLTDLVAPTKLQSVSDWILATQTHQLDFSNNTESSTDLAYVLDIDLTILGSSPERFMQYEQQIRQEYYWVEPSLYRAKRAELLSAFLQQSNIYYTHYFQQLLEQQARANLQDLITQLQA